MGKVHIVQCLCPRRHAIVALAYEEGAEQYTPENAPGKLKEMVESLVASNLINHVCVLCGSVTFIYEDGVTRFNSMEEARPELARLQAANILTRVRHEMKQSN